MKGAPRKSQSAPVVVSLGECLWDQFDDGARFGGAPANLACHVAALGAETHLLSAIGDDIAGEEALKILRDHRVNTDCVARIEGSPTGSVQVTLDPDGGPSYEIAKDVAWDHIPWRPEFAALARRADAVCFGTLAQRTETSRQTLERFLDETRPDCLRVFDVNLRGSFYNRELIETSLGRATVFKFSEEERPVLAKLLELPMDAPELIQMQKLRERFDLSWIVLTQGGRGAILLGESIQVTAEAEPVKVIDTVGAGDAFTAALTVGLMTGRPANDLLAHACRVAAHVCTQAGAVPGVAKN